MKKITTFLLALLLTIPAMAVTFNSGDVIYLNAGGSGLWDQGGAKFSAAFDDADFASEFGKKTDEGYYIFTVPGTGKSYEGVRFVRNTNAATSPGWDPKWNETNKITAIEGKNLYTITGWGGADGSWSTYTPTVAEELVIPDGLFSYNEGQFAIFLVNKSNWATVNAWIWGDGNNNYTGGTWPGKEMTKVDGEINGKYECYKWVYTGAYTNEPTGLIFNNGSNQTSDLEYVNGGVYDNAGNLLTTIAPTPVVEPTITLSYSPETIYVGDVVTLSSTVQNGEGYTVKYYVDGVENGETWTPTAAGEYTIAANLMNGSDVVAFDEKVVTVNEHSTLTFTVEVPTGTENVNIAGTFNGWSASQTPMNQVGISNVFTVTLNDVDKETVQYKYVTNQSWDNVEVAADNSDVGNRSYSENDVVAKWKDISVYYPENIVCEQNYYLDTNNLWNTDEAWFAAYFFNKNTDAHTWVAGELLSTGYYLFYLSQYNVPAAAPARAKAEEAPVYTHVIFTRMNPAYSVLDWDLTEEVDNGNGSTTTNVLEDRVWNQTADLAYDGGEARTYQITTADGEGNWISLPTGLEAVEADGMVYAGNVVSAEGAIEVYNLSGAVVAYGENRVDLNGLAGGVYVVRCGNDVMKVVR